MGHMTKNTETQSEKSERAIISNRIYLKPDMVSRKSIIDALTYKIPRPGRPGRGRPRIVIETIRNYKVLPNGILSLPQGRQDLIPPWYEILDRRILVPQEFPEPSLELYPMQKEVYENLNDSGFINARVAFGKTFTALHVAAKLGQKTLIVTHTVAIREHWAQEIKKLFGIDASIIGSGKYETSGPIVVGNIQSLVKYRNELSKMFGTLILDEAHHVPASVFNNFIDAMYCRYRIGLSGTMIRGDGKHVVLQDIFSHTVVEPSVDNSISPYVHIVKTGMSIPAASHWATRINKLLYDENYQQFIARLAIGQINKGHSVLIIAGRVEFLNNVAEYIGDDCAVVTGTSGGTTDVDKAKYRETVSKAIDIGAIKAIAGSRQIFSEGVSINRLSCVILAEPMKFEGTLEQIIGRIMRDHPDKIHPEVYDIAFNDVTGKRQLQNRRALYEERGWKITEV